MSKARRILSEVSDITAPDRSMERRGVFDLIKVELINGEEYREKNIVFTMGGHHYVYEDIPEDTVYVDGDMSKEDAVCTEIHELVERCLMKHLGIDYSPEEGEGAHEVANKAETAAREFLNKKGRSAA